MEAMRLSNPVAYERMLRRKRSEQQRILSEVKEKAEATRAQFRVRPFSVLVCLSSCQTTMNPSYVAAVSSMEAEYAEYEDEDEDGPEYLTLSPEPDNDADALPDKMAFERARRLYRANTLNQKQRPERNSLEVSALEDVLLAMPDQEFLANRELLMEESDRDSDADDGIDETSPLNESGF